MIYFDNAATTLMKPPAVAQAVLDAINTFGGPGRASHAPALHAARCVFRARGAVAALLGGSPERVAFTANATEALNIAIGGLLSHTDHAITTVLEHNSVLRPLYHLRGVGMGLSIVGVDAGGHLDYAGFERALRPNTRAVVCTHASNVTGALVDLSEIAGFCRRHGLLLIVDAAQTAGVFPIDADALGIDALCFTGHKGLLGPQGTGGLCVKAGLPMAPIKRGGSGFDSFSEAHPAYLPEALEAGTLNAHGLAGLLAGIHYIEETGLDAICRRELALCDAFIEAVREMPGVRVYGDPARPHAPIALLNIGDLDAADVGDRLAAQGICVRTGAHCAPLIHRALGTHRRGAVRFSFSSLNTDAELETAIAAIAEIAHQAH